MSRPYFRCFLCGFILMKTVFLFIISSSNVKTVFSMFFIEFKVNLYHKKCIFINLSSSRAKTMFSILFHFSY